jgi:hypothetical protein
MVRTTYGQKVKGLGRCHKVSIQIQNLELQTRYYALPLSEMDMVLGAKWLTQLGTYTTNLQEHFMQFKWHEKNYKLYGLGSPHHPLKDHKSHTSATNKSPKYSKTKLESR